MSKKDFIAIAILILLSIVYIIVPSFHDSGESLFTASKIETAVRDGNTLSLFNTHKPFYHMAMFALYKGASAVFPEATALSFLKGFNLAVGLLTLWLFFALIRTMTVQPFTALFAALFLSFCYVFWYSSREAGGGILALFLTVVYLFFLFKLHSAVPSPVFHLILGIVLGLILLLDITALLLIIPAFFYNPYGKDYQLGLKLVTLAVALFILLAGFAIIYEALGMDDVGNYSNLLLKGLDVNYYTGKESGVFQLEAASALKPLTLTGAGLVGSGTNLSPIFQVAAGLLLIGILIIAIIKWEDYENKEKDLTLFSFAWLIPMLIFYALWSSAAKQSSLLWMLPIAIIFGVTIFGGKWAALNRTALVIGILLFAVLIGGNLATTILPASSPDSNPSYMISEWLKANTSKDDLVLFFETSNESETDTLFWHYLPFEAKRQTFTIDWTTAADKKSERISAVIDEILGAGAKVFLFIREDSESAVTIDMFEQIYPVYDYTLLDKGTRYSIYGIIK
jgi:hypothetical protein